MSGPKVVSYAVAEAQRRLMAETARRQQAQRRWRLAYQQREQLRYQASQAGRRYGAVIAAVPALAEHGQTDPDAIGRLAAAATAETDRLRRQVAAAAARAAAGQARDHAVGLGAGLRASAAAASWESDLAEAQRLIGRMALEAEVPPRLRDLVDEVATAPEPRRPALLAAIREQVDRVNAAVRDRRETAAALAEAELVAADTGDPHLRALIDLGRVAVAAGRPVDATALRHVLVEVEERHRADRERAYVQQSLIAAFTELGYHVLTPQSGVLLEQTAAPGHGVRVRIDAGGISLEPVRLVEATVDGIAGVPSQADDLRAEQAFCDDFSQVTRALARSGVRLGPVRGAPPGTVPPRPVAVRKPARPRRRKPPGGAIPRARQERQL